MSIREPLSIPVPLGALGGDGGLAEGVGALDDDQLGQLRHILLGMLDVLSERIAATSELQRRLHDPATHRDIVHEILEERMAEVRAEFEAAVLALEAMGRDAYGSCRSCGRTIGFDRLRTRPTASSCSACEDGDPVIGPAGGPHLSDINLLREIS